jgi:DNA invertase Pin-like site-specific DNA recombinase
MKKVTAAIYVRVSTATKVRGTDSAFLQNPEVQEMPLRQLADQRGWTVSRVYSDRASGAKENRPGLKALMADARRGAFQVVLVWRFDRFARSVEQLVSALAEFRRLKVDFVSHQEALDTGTPNGKSDVHHYRGNGRIGEIGNSRKGPSRPRLRPPERY